MTVDFPKPGGATSATTFAEDNKISLTTLSLGTLSADGVIGVILAMSIGITEVMPYSLVAFPIFPSSIILPNGPCFIDTVSKNLADAINGTVITGIQYCQFTIGYRAFWLS